LTALVQIQEDGETRSEVHLETTAWIRTAVHKHEKIHLVVSLFEG